MTGMVKGPAVFLNQFAGDTPPFNSFDGMCGWAASLGYKGVQIRLGSIALSTSARRRSRRLIAMNWPEPRKPMTLRSPNSRVMSRPSSSL